MTNAWLRPMFRTSIAMRGYGLGERNPETLPNPADPQSETELQNRIGMAHWQSLRRTAQHETAIAGMRY